MRAGTLRYATYRFIFTLWFPIVPLILDVVEKFRTSTVRVQRLISVVGYANVYSQFQPSSI